MSEAPLLIMLPGFASAPALFEPLAAALAPDFRVRTLALPAFAAAPLAQFSAQAVLAALAEQIPAGAWLAGWSLGAMLAVQLAARTGARGVITLGANACFVAQATYPAAMKLSTNQAFNQSFAQLPQAALKRFYALITLGEPNARALTGQLRAAAPEFNPQWLDYLELLAQLDNRAALAALPCPCWHILASDDALVPVQAGAALLECNPSHLLAQVEGSHAGLLLMPERVRKALQQLGVLATTMDGVSLR